MATRPVLRIFISSTAVDLRDYRDKVRDAVLRLDSLPSAMETFSAKSGQPASECMREAAEADAIICIVAHRYGYVPPRELGGDGERSITWLEVDAAKRAGKPVFAFLVDPKAPWTELKEQDRLTSEPPDKAPEIVKAVQKLQEFKAYLERETTRQIFTNPDDLATHVTAALHNFTPRHDHAPTSTARVWQPLFCHALQPAQHFRGRDAKLQDLKDWLESPVTADRVLSVVAAGGTGKTALVDKALHEAKLSDRAGVFVWSFYEDPHTDAFLRAAYLYFTGEKDTPAGGMLERLQLALSGDAPHVLILDGLERVQSDEGLRRRGELEDVQLKRLLRALAGGIGNARALVTSRYPLVDLDNWTGAGHRAIVLDDLELPVALEVLRAWGVNSNDDTLKDLIEPLSTGGFYHALSVAVLGSYLGNFAGGDPSRAPELSIGALKDSDDPKARRLSRILEQYVKALTAVERDLLARLSLFPRGIRVEFLGWMVQSGGEVAGALIGLKDQQLVRHLERLKALGLVFRYETDRQAVYSAHPFLRDFIRTLLGAKPESVHDSIRAKLAPSLEAKPTTKPSDPAMLDQYELLIEQTLLAGRAQEAFDLYYQGLGNYRNLSWTLGENARGLRILERFVPQGRFLRIDPLLSLHDRSVLVNDLGLFAKDQGDLTRAREPYAHCQSLGTDSVGAENLAEVELNAGRFPQALDYAESAVSLAAETKDDIDTKFSLASRATAHFALGASPPRQRTFSVPPNWMVDPCTAYAESARQRANCFGATGPEPSVRHERTGSSQSKAPITTFSAAVTPSSAGFPFPTIPPKPPDTFRMPVFSPIAPETSTFSSAASTPRANSTAISGIFPNPSSKPKPAFSSPTPAASDSSPSTSASPSPKPTSPPETPTKPSKTPATRSTARKRPTANTPGAKPTASTSAASLTSGSARPSSPASASPPPSISASASATAASTKPAAPYGFSRKPAVPSALPSRARQQAVPRANIVFTFPA
jgi:tetratricopeptide (TPR) repeat protein